MNTYEISNQDGIWIKLLIVNPKHPDNTSNYYAIDKIKSIQGIYQEGIGTFQSDTDNRKMNYRFEDKAQVVIAFINEDSNPSIVFDIQEVSNQTWKDNAGGLQVGLQQAIDAIKGWKVA
jgi:hypothetical protein